MTRKEFLFYDREMRRIPRYDFQHRAPADCQSCEYHEPNWKYRFCRHLYCPYRMKNSTIRDSPLPDQLCCEAVSMDVV